ncbi:MAG: molybdate ABC transporter substrate-binding protein [Opitutaceae bacterium]|nr:molybdate ABC transporter substrate-binding protein [Opitutaceae bacterium]
MSPPYRSLLRLLAALHLPLAAAGAAEITVFAAASLSDALAAIATRYESLSGDTIRFNFGASSTLARQIREGAPADVFFPADEAKMEELVRAGLIDPAVRLPLLSNSLVIIIPVNAGESFAGPGDLLGKSVRRLALAEPQTVPAGIYAKEFLEKAGLWKDLRHKIIPTENVRTALAAVAAGNAEAGIVYKTDARISKAVKIAFEIPRAEGPRIIYPVALLRSSKQPVAARAWITYLTGVDARAVFTRFGFLPVDPER